MDQPFETAAMLRMFGPAPGTASDDAAQIASPNLGGLPKLTGLPLSNCQGLADAKALSRCLVGQAALHLRRTTY